jgi:hypothetical protein
VTSKHRYVISVVDPQHLVLRIHHLDRRIRTGPRTGREGVAA